MSYLVSEAVFSPCRRYRYHLKRVWQADKDILTFVLLNPSTATATKDDPTISRCIGFARRLGYGGLETLNLFAWRATNPSELSNISNPVGKDNDRHLSNVGGKIIVGWGQNGAWQNRDKEVLALLPKNIWCLGLNKDGSPKHPLYLPQITLPISYPKD